jgi:hypothetical protein
MKPMLLAALGFGSITLGRLDLNEISEITNTVMGASLVSAAHYMNWKLLRSIAACKH